MALCLGLTFGGHEASGQGLPAAPTPVPGGLLDRGRPAAPAKPAPEQASPAEQPSAREQAAPRPQAPGRPQQASPAPAAQPTPRPAAAPKPVAQRRAPPPSLSKLEPVRLKVPAEYVRPRSPRGSATEVLLSAVGTELAPRYAKGGRCAAPKAKCPDFTNLIVFRAREDVAATVAERYKAPIDSLKAMPAQHGLSRIPPRAARGSTSSHFLAEVAGRPVWIVCNRYDSARKPRPEARFCELTFDAGEDMGGRLIFHEARLDQWRGMHAAAVSLIRRLQG